MDSFSPVPQDKFSFGLWTVGNPGRDPFGAPVRPVVKPTVLVENLARIGAYGVNLHDDDLVPFGSSAAERETIVRDFKAALKNTGLVVPMATTNLFSHPVFKDGAFTSSDPKVRLFALQKTMLAMDLGVELGAEIYVFWGGREGSETDAARDPRDAIRYLRDAMNFLCEYARDMHYNLKFALEAKPNEPRGDIYLPTTGHMLHFITTLDHPEMVGVNPETAHETMAGLSFPHAVAQALECKKLFHIDLNAQRIGRYDQDLRFGSEDLKSAFFLVRLLEGCAGYPRYDGPRHFDAHAYRTEDMEGVWDFARGCMRTYKILAARARTFDADPEVKSLIDAANPDSGAVPTPYSRAVAAALKTRIFDVDQLAARGLKLERLDQLVIEHLMGVR